MASSDDTRVYLCGVELLRKDFFKVVGIPVEMLTVFHRVWNVFTFLKDCGHGNRVATIYPQSKCGDAFRGEHGVTVLSRVVSILVGLQEKCDDMRIECDSHPQILAGHVSAR